MRRFWMGAICAALAACSGSEPQATETNSVETASQSSEPDTITAKTMADMNLKALLKDADSAKFRNVTLSRIDGGNLMMCGEVNSKNSLGGYTGFKRFIASPNPSAPTIIEGETDGIDGDTFRQAQSAACSNVVERFS